MKSQGVKEQSNEASPLYNKDTMNNVLREYDRIGKYIAQNKKKIEEFIEFVDKIDLRVGDVREDNEEVIFKKRQALLDKLNEVLEREVSIYSESETIQDSLKTLNEKIEKMRKDVMESAGKIVNREDGVIEEMTRLEEYFDKIYSIRGIQSTGQERKREIGEMKKRVEENTKRIGMKRGNCVRKRDENVEWVTKKVDNTKMTYDEYLKIKKEGVEYRNVCFNYEDREKYGDIIPEGVNVLESVKEDGYIYGCFSKCSSLISISIPSSVISIGERCFECCRSLIDISIPDSVSSIGEWCFSDCRSLRSISIPGSVISIGNCCFVMCTTLKEMSIPDSVRSIGYYCFYDCRSLTSINIPSSVNSIGSSCFSGCSSITSINIPSSVNSIGERCFDNCSSMRSITIPSKFQSEMENLFGSNFRGIFGSIHRRGVPVGCEVTYI